MFDFFEVLLKDKKRLLLFPESFQLKYIAKIIDFCEVFKFFSKSFERLETMNETSSDKKMVNANQLYILTRTVVNPGHLLDLILRNSNYRNFIFNNDRYLMQLKVIFKNSIYKFDIDIEPQEGSNLDDIDILFAICKYKQSTCIVSEYQVKLNKIAIVFFSFCLKLCSTQNEMKDNFSKISHTLSNMFHCTAKRFSKSILKKLFQISLDFLSSCPQLFGKAPKEYMILLISCCVKIIQAFLVSDPGNFKKYNIESLQVVHQFSSNSFSAYLNGTSLQSVKFKMLEFTG